VEIGIGLDQSLGLTIEQQRELVREAVGLGYDSAWRNASLLRDVFQVLGQWWPASAEVKDGGIGTGVSVVPVPVWSAQSLANAAGTLGELTGGRFVLGVGSGGIHEAGYQRMHNLPAWPPIAMMRDYLVVLRKLLAGETVNYDGPVLKLHGVSLGYTPPRVPIVVGALGEQMVRLSGELSDGAALNWCTAEQVAWSREQLEAGARRGGRDPSEVKLVEYIRVSVDDDVDAARRAYTRHLLGYALARPGGRKDRGYRAHFGRMGFEASLGELEERRERGAPVEEIVEAFPRELLGMVGYYGPAAGAAEAFKRLAVGLDVAIVRVVPARPGAESVAAVMRACRPELVQA
jgi:alkanesulfonate monooxygenase SsuD/methylene tetrahydromethanopterin reductase-like flavin-dependent oxidoreductase (luciferase family)